MMLPLQKIRTRHAWIDALEAKSPLIKTLDLKSATTDDVYLGSGATAAANGDALNFANSEAHNNMVVGTIEGLSRAGAPTSMLRKLLIDLTSRNTYGTFCELSGYAFLLNGDIPFDPQVAMSGAEILNPQGSDLDGVMRLPARVFFDVKAFGFHEHLVEKLTNRLSQDLAPDIVTSGGSWDVSIDLLFELLGAQYAPLRQELAAKKAAARDVLRFVVRPRKPVTVSSRSVNVQALAAQNAGYVFRYAKQFVRSEPFFLFFVVHPWLSGSSFHQNFSGSFDAFLRAFGEQVFRQFSGDQTPVLGVSRDQASRLLTGMIFIHGWEDVPAAAPPRYRCLLNPNATNKVPAAAMNTLRAAYGNALAIVEIPPA